MRWGIIAVALATITGCAPPYDPTASPASEAVDLRARTSTLRVRNVGCPSVGIGTGSGFALDAHTLVSNRHVVEGAIELQLSTWDGVDYRVTDYTYSVVNDLAVVRVEAPLPVESVLAALPVPGATVFVAGYPAGGAWRLVPGTVLDVVDGAVYGESGEVFKVAASIQPGNSGGPVFDRAGAVVGVVFAIDPTSGAGLAIPVAALSSVAQTTSAPDVEC